MSKIEDKTTNLDKVVQAEVARILKEKEAESLKAAEIEKQKRVQDEALALQKIEARKAKERKIKRIKSLQRNGRLYLDTADLDPNFSYYWANNYADGTGNIRLYRDLGYEVVPQHELENLGIGTGGTGLADGTKFGSNGVPAGAGCEAVLMKIPKEDKEILDDINKKRIEITEAQIRAEYDVAKKLVTDLNN